MFGVAVVGGGGGGINSHETLRPKPPRLKPEVPNPQFLTRNPHATLKP